MTEITKLSDSSPQVLSAWVVNSDQAWTTGWNGVESIVIYNEPGDGAYVPWLCITMINGSQTRIAAKHCGITLAKENSKGSCSDCGDPLDGNLCRNPRCEKYMQVVLRRRKWARLMHAASGKIYDDSWIMMGEDL